MGEETKLIQIYFTGLGATVTWPVTSRLLLLNTVSVKYFELHIRLDMELDCEQQEESEGSGRRHEQAVLGTEGKAMAAWIAKLSGPPKKKHTFSACSSKVDRYLEKIQTGIY